MGGESLTLRIGVGTYSVHVLHSYLAKSKDHCHVTHAEMGHVASEVQKNA